MDIKVFRIYDPMDTNPTNRPLEEVMSFKDLRKGDVFLSRDSSGKIQQDDLGLEWFRAMSDPFINNGSLDILKEGIGVMSSELEARIDQLL